MTSFDSLRNEWPKILIALVVGLYFVFLNPFPDFYAYNSHDPATYLNRAQSIWSGAGYVERYADRIANIKLQVPGFSLMLAPVVGLWGINFYILKAYMVVLTIPMALSFYFFFNYFLGNKKSAFLLTLLLLANPVIFEVSHQLLAEVPLILFSSLALVCSDRYVRDENRRPVISLLVCFLLIFAAYFMKPTAIAIVAGICFMVFYPWVWTKKRFSKIVFLAVLGCLPLVIWHIRNSFVPTDGFWGRSSLDYFVLKDPYLENSEIATLSDWGIRIRHNLVWGMVSNAAMSWISPIFYLKEQTVMSFLLGIPICAVLIYGFAERAIKNPSVLEGFVLFSSFIMLITFDGHSERYMLFLYPVFLIYGWTFLTRYFSSLKYVLLGILLTTSLVVTTGQGISRFKDPFRFDEYHDFLAATQAAADVLPKGSACASPAPAYWQLLSGHGCYYENDQWKLEAGPEAKPDYIVTLVSGYDYEKRPNANSLLRGILLEAKDLRNRIQSSDLDLTNIYNNDTFALWKRNP